MSDAAPRARGADDAGIAANPLVALGHARIAVATVFFLNGFGFAGWVPRLAEIKAALRLSEGELGLALLCVALGALLTMPLTGIAVGRLGSRACTLAAVLAFSMAPVVLALAPNALILGFGFFVIGATSGGLDVAMNAQAVAVERRIGRPIMSSFHGLFSLGAMAGALAAGGVAAAGVGLVAHLLAAGVVIALLGAMAGRLMLTKAQDVGDGGPAFALPGRGILGFGAIAFCALLAEGAVADWSAVYLRESLGAGTTVAAAAFAAFSATMAAGRLAGDRVVVRVGGRAVVRAGGLLAALGLGGTLLIGHPLAAVAGFALVGAGIACVFPVVLSSAAAMSNQSAGTVIAAICTLGYLGFMVGPPAIGFAAEVAGLPVALGIVVALCAGIWPLGRVLGAADQPQADFGRT